MNITLKTKIDYDFSNFEVTPEKQLAIIRKYEKQVDDVYLDWVSVEYTTNSKGEEWFKISIRMMNCEMEFDYDKTLYVTQDAYSKIQKILTTEDKPFYDTLTYKYLGLLANELQNVKYSLVEAISIIKHVSTMMHTELPPTV